LKSKKLCIQTNAEFSYTCRILYYKLLINLTSFCAPSGVTENCSCAGNSIRVDLRNPDAIPAKANCICSAEATITILGRAIYPLRNRSGSGSGCWSGHLIILTGLYNSWSWITKNCIRARDTICEGLGNPNVVCSVSNLSRSAKAANPVFVRASYPCTNESGCWSGGNRWS
jgi:hypothetical protein